VVTFASGTTAAQVLTIAAAPALTRLYAPHDLGILSLFTAVVALFASAAAWRYDYAIILPRRDAEAANLFGLSCFIVILMAGLAAVVVVVAGDRLSEALGAPDLAPFLPLAPVAVIAIGLYLPLSSWAARRRHYKEVSIAQIVRSIGGTAIQIVLGLLKSGPAGLILGVIMGQLIAGGTLVGQIWRKDGRLIAASLDPKEIWWLGREHSDFPMFSMPSAYLFAVTQTVPAMLLAMCFDPAVAGGYWLASRICQMPIALLGEAVRQVFYERAASQFNRDEGQLLILAKSTMGLAFIVFVPFAIMILFAPKLFEAAFGEAWVYAGTYSQWLIVPWTVEFICTPSLTLVPIYSHQRLLLVFQCLTLVPRLGVIPFASYVGNDRTAIAMYAMAGAIFHLSILLFVFLRSWRHQLSLVRAASAKV